MLVGIELPVVTLRCHTSSEDGVTTAPQISIQLPSSRQASLPRLFLTFDSILLSQGCTMAIPKK
jgi:hypothetical protein